MKTKNSVYNKDGFFNIKGWFDKIGVNFLKDVHTLIITSPRNNGKTFSCWNLILELWNTSNHEWKIAICRTNDLKMKESIASFKAAYAKEYEVVGGFIYKIERDEKNKVKEGSRKMCGRFVNVENEHNYRSPVDLGFDGFKFMFWDEFNETKQTSLDLFTKWTMLLSTVERFNRPFIHLILGNKINANNDLFIRFNLNTSRRNLNKDHIQRISDRITYIDVGFDTYKQIGNDKSMVSEVASFDDKANKLFNEGGFLEGTFYNVINYLNFTNAIPKYYFTIDQSLVEYGIFSNSDYGENLHYIKEVKEPTLPLNIIALNVVGYANQGQTITDEDLIEVANILFKKLQKRDLYFSSFFIMDTFEKWLFKKTSTFGG